jgi:hypothetical protein
MSVDVKFYQSVIAQVEADLAALEPQRAALTGTLQNVRELLKAASVPSQIPISNIQHAPQTEDAPRGFFVPHGAFERMSNKEAVIKSLELADRPLTVREVVNAIESSGYKHNSNNYWNTIYTVLTRLVNDKKAKKVGDAFELTASKDKDGLDELFAD